METQDPDNTKEQIFRNWACFEFGKWMANDETMGKEAFDALGEYRHFKCNQGNNPVMAQERSQKGAADFKRITGYDVEVFLAFLRSLPKPE